MHRSKLSLGAPEVLQSNYAVALHILEVLRAVGQFFEYLQLEQSNNTSRQKIDSYNLVLDLSGLDGRLHAGSKRSMLDFR
jgi:hypothetical protein